MAINSHLHYHEVTCLTQLTCLTELFRNDSDIPPLRNVHWLNNPRDLVNERDRSSDVVENTDVANLFPRHWHVLHQLQHGMRHVFQRTVHQKYSRLDNMVKRLCKQDGKMSMCRLLKTTDISGRQSLVTLYCPSVTPAQHQTTDLTPVEWWL